MQAFRVWDRRWRSHLGLPTRWVFPWPELTAAGQAMHSPEILLETLIVCRTPVAPSERGLPAALWPELVAPASQELPLLLAALLKTPASALESQGAAAWALEELLGVALLELQGDLSQSVTSVELPPQPTVWQEPPLLLMRVAWQVQ